MPKPGRECQNARGWAVGVIRRASAVPRRLWGVPGRLREGRACCYLCRHREGAFAKWRLWTFLDLSGLLFAVWGGLLAKKTFFSGADCDFGKFLHAQKVSTPAKSPRKIPHAADLSKKVAARSGFGSLHKTLPVRITPTALVKEMLHQGVRPKTTQQSPAKQGVDRNTPNRLRGHEVSVAQARSWRCPHQRCGGGWGDRSPQARSCASARSAAETWAFFVSTMVWMAFRAASGGSA